jgi:hypothetical protein
MRELLTFLIVATRNFVAAATVFFGLDDCMSI